MICQKNSYIGRMEGIYWLCPKLVIMEDARDRNDCDKANDNRGRNGFSSLNTTWSYEYSPVRSPGFENFYNDL